MEVISSPLVLIISEGQQSALEIINKIRKLPENENVTEISNIIGIPLKGYNHKIVNKYYEAQISFVPYEDDVETLPPDIISQVEGLLIYFDPKKKSFSSKIPTYASFLEDNDIELGILLCDLLFDDASEGLTYKEVKQQCTLLDVIELERTNEDNEDNHLNPCGYDELHQVLRNVIWSNVNMNRNSQSGSVITQSGDQDQTTSNQSANNGIEKELEFFEKLLGEVLMFKDSTKGFSRNERLLYAEKIAGKFDKLLEDDSSDAEE